MFLILENKLCSKV